MSVTFHGTYIDLGSFDSSGAHPPVAGSVVITPLGGAPTNATLDADGHYSATIGSFSGKVTVVETITGLDDPITTVYEVLDSTTWDTTKEVFIPDSSSDLPGGPFATPASVAAAISALSGTYAEPPVAADAIIYVSKGASASDSNTGLSAGRAKATLAAAIAALPAAGGVVQLLDGTHSPVGAVTGKSNLVVRGQGYGTVLNVSSADKGFDASGLSRITIEDLRVTGSSARALSFVGCTDVTVRRCWVSGATVSNGTTYTAGIFLSGTTGALIQDNILSGNGIGASASRGADILHDTTAGSGVRIIGNRCTSTAVHFNIAGYNLTDSTIEGNTVSGAITDGTNNSGYGIVLYQTLTCRRNHVLNNIVSATQGTGIYLEVQLESKVNGNTVTGCATVQTDASLPVGGVVLNGCPDAHVLGNTIRSSGKCGIAIASAGARNIVALNNVDGSATHGIWVRGANDHSFVALNIITNSTGRGVLVFGSALAGLTIQSNTINTTSGTAAGIDASSAITHFRITGNSVSDSGGYGIVTSGGGSRGTVSMNVVKNAGAGNPGVYDGIHSLTTDTLITGNQSYNLSTSNQNYGIRDGSAGTNNVITENHVSGNVTGGIIAPAPATVFNNIGMPDGFTNLSDGFDLSGFQPHVTHSGFNNYVVATSSRQSNGAQNNSVVMRLPGTLRAGTWTLALWHSRGTNRGIYTLATSPDNSTWTDKGTVDGYVGVADDARNEITGVAIPAGTRYVRLTMATQNGSSSSFFGVWRSLHGVRTGA